MPGNCRETRIILKRALAEPPDTIYPSPARPSRFALRDIRCVTIAAGRRCRNGRISTPGQDGPKPGGSRMSCLKLYWPSTWALYAPSESEALPDDGVDEAPVILAFPSAQARRNRGDRLSILERARLIHENRCCPECHRAAVVPVDSEPAVMFRNQMPVPGAGTLLGFACDACGHEWPA